MSELRGEYVIEEQSPSDFLLFIRLRKKWGLSSEGNTDFWKEVLCCNVLLTAGKGGNIS